MVTQQRRFLMPGKKWALSLLLPLLVFLVGCSGVVSQPTPTPPPFTRLNLSIPSQALNAPVTGPVPTTQILHIGVTFKLDQKALDQMDQHGLASTDGQNTDISKLGIDDQTYQRIKDFFGISDAQLKLSSTHTWLSIYIQAGSLGKLLQTSFINHKLDGRVFYTPDMTHPPVLPTVLTGTILSISGLDSYSQARAPVQRGHSGKNLPQKADATCPQKSSYPFALFPSDISHVYGMDRFSQLGLHGEGMKVLLVEGFDPYDLQNDIQPYFDCVGYHGNLSTVTLDGVPSGNFGETTLDIEMVAGLAPGADIVDYQGDAWGGNFWVVINDLLQRIITDYQHNTNTGTVVSISIESTESSQSQSDLNAINQSLAILTQGEHMSVFISTGDCGAYGLDDYGTLSASFPASDPWAVAVGGTVLTTDQNGNRDQEISWSDDATDHDQCHNSWGTGGGLSQVYSQPSWQKSYSKNITGLQNSYSNGKRQEADIALAATSLLFRFQGAWSDLGGGTSASAPMAAAGQVLVNQVLAKSWRHYYYGPESYYFAATRTGFFHPYFDVTVGDNIYYHATKGWDYPTGLGVPNYGDLYVLLAANFS
ncbi:MAG TPA: S53 family peptidase [Ktedonobacteraceae bacterium]|nr:S53 family peptidase [Ktedonobacteraceae bacterium]